MVFVEGGNPPTYKHHDLESAETEAQRLAKLTNKKVYVLTTIKSYKLSEFYIEDNRPDINDLPF